MSRCIEDASSTSPVAGDKSERAPHETATPRNPGINPSIETAPLRLAYSIRETADLLGVSYTSVYRLIARGLLKSSSALRHKLIPHTEILRFLKTTTVAFAVIALSTTKPVCTLGARLQASVGSQAHFAGHSSTQSHS